VYCGVPVLNGFPEYLNLKRYSEAGKLSGAEALGSQVAYMLLSKILIFRQ
jgi:hypothetical protein